jgi:hypothetical protein
MLIPEKDIALVINTNNESANKTVYFSAKSSLSLDETNRVEESYHSSIEDSSLFKLSQLEDSFDSVVEDNIETYNKNDYNLMNQYIKSEEYDKLKDLQNKILKEEIDKRKAVNLKRLNKLNKLQEKMYNLEKKTEKIKNNQKLVLANTDPDLGYFIVPEDKFLTEYQEQKFCDYIFYTKNI